MPLGPGLIAGTVIGSLAGPLTSLLDQGLKTQLPYELVSPTDLVDMYHRGALTIDGYYGFMRRHGYDHNTSQAFYYSKDAILTPEQATSQRIHERLKLIYDATDGSITQTEILNNQLHIYNSYLRRMKRQGYRNSEALDSFTANRPLPSFSVILEWLAKEVFEPLIYTKFGFDQEEPTALRTYMSAYGVPNQEASNYWISHWATIGRESWNELYQRFREDRNTANYSDIDFQELAEAGVTWNQVKINEADYNDYYTVLELSPYFRNRGRGAAYSPLPFTVLQQLWQYAVLPYNQMVGRLRDYGYSKRSSELILEAWQRKFPYGAKEPLRDNITWKFSKRLITRTQATTELTAVGVTSDAIEFLLNQIDDKVLEKENELALASLRTKAAGTVLTESQLKGIVRQILGTNVGTRVDYEVSKIMEYVREKTTRVNLRIVSKGFGAGTISETEFTDYMRSRYYSETDIALAKKSYGPAI